MEGIYALFKKKIVGEGVGNIRMNSSNFSNPYLLLPIKKGMHYLLGAFAGIRMG
jgi:hypothetical protein